MTTTIQLLPFATLLGSLEEDLRVTSEDVASALGVDRRTVERWRDGTIPQERARTQLNSLNELRERLLESLGSDGASRWLHTPSRYFGGIAPIKAIRGAGVDGILAALEALETGAYL